MLELYIEKHQRNNDKPKRSDDSFKIEVITNDELEKLNSSFHQRRVIITQINAFVKNHFTQPLTGAFKLIFMLTIFKL